MNYKKNSTIEKKSEVLDKKYHESNTQGWSTPEVVMN